MSDYYTQSGTPSTGAQGSSAAIRGEFFAIQNAFDKLPVLSGNGSKFVAVNGSESGLVAINAALSLGGFFNTYSSGKSITLRTTGTTNVTLPSGGVALMSTTDGRISYQNSWTPVLKAGLMGDLSVSYSTQYGEWSRYGPLVLIKWSVLGTLTYTTANWSLYLDGLPFTISGVGDLTCTTRIDGPFTLNGEVMKQSGWLGYNWANFGKYVTWFLIGPDGVYYDYGIEDIPSGSVFQAVGSATYYTTD